MDAVAWDTTYPQMSGSHQPGPSTHGPVAAPPVAYGSMEAPCPIHSPWQPGQCGAPDRPERSEPAAVITS